MNDIHMPPISPLVATLQGSEFGCVGEGRAQKGRADLPDSRIEAFEHLKTQTQLNTSTLQPKEEVDEWGELKNTLAADTVKKTECTFKNQRYVALWRHCPNG